VRVRGIGLGTSEIRKHGVKKPYTIIGMGNESMRDTLEKRFFEFQRSIHKDSCHILSDWLTFKREN